MRTAKGYGVIELLLALGIVALLVVVTLPRYERSQVRSKVATARADLRQLAAALESYALDNSGHYAFDIDPRGWPWYPTDVLTTPVCYLPGPRIPDDPFGSQRIPLDRRLYRYVNYPANLNPGWPPCYIPPPPDGPYHTRWTPVPDSTVNEGIEIFGEWKLSSGGPDRLANSNFFTSELVYDPSNGTVSGGDLIRCQRRGEI